MSESLSQRACRWRRREGGFVDDSTLTALDTVDCLRGREREVEELAGGLTNVNLKVTTTQDTVVVGSRRRAASCSLSTVGRST